MTDSGAVNGLPPHLTLDEVPEAKPNWRHQWLYSVIPIGRKTEAWYNSPTTPQIDYPLVAFLTGFCRNCGRAFSQEIPVNDFGYYRETAMSIPQDGCLPPQ